MIRDLIGVQFSCSGSGLRGNSPIGLPFDAAALGIVMQIYLPIAEVSIQRLLLLGAGRELWGIIVRHVRRGLRFLMTPLLLFHRHPAARRCGPQATTQIVASSGVAFLAHLPPQDRRSGGWKQVLLARRHCRLRV